MLRRFKRPGVGAGYIVAGMLAIACDSAPTGNKTADEFNAPDAASTALSANLHQASLNAAAAGNLSSATALENGAIAVTYGLSPSTIQVSVDGETTGYQAIVVGTVVELSPGDTAISRSLIAWAVRGDSTIATLDVATLGDVGSFSSEFEPASDPRGRAQGVWANLVRNSRWVATIGTAGLSVEATGHQCPRRFDEFRCTLASYGVFIDGVFRLDGASPDDQKPAVRIFTDARGVAGVLLSKNDPRMRTPDRERHPGPARDPRGGGR